MGTEWPQTDLSDQMAGGHASRDPGACLHQSSHLCSSSDATVIDGESLEVLCVGTRQTVRSRLVEGRTEEVVGLARSVYQERQAAGSGGSSGGDWSTAEDLLIRETFQRQLGCTLSLVSSLKARAPCSHISFGVILSLCMTAVHGWAQNLVKWLMHAP